MLAKNCNITDLENALNEVNLSFDDNIKFKRLDNTNRGIRFTLSVHSSRNAGSRIGYSGKRVCAACWHAHGEFFESLFELMPDAIIKATDKTITKDQGNWEDWNIGSVYSPLWYSDACDCL